MLFTRQAEEDWKTFWNKQFPDREEYDRKFYVQGPICLRQLHSAAYGPGNKPADVWYVGYVAVPVNFWTNQLAGWGDIDITYNKPSYDQKYYILGFDSWKKQVKPTDMIKKAYDLWQHLTQKIVENNKKYKKDLKKIPKSEGGTQNEGNN